jgi:hypothetical protein
MPRTPAWTAAILTVVIRATASITQLRPPVHTRLRRPFAVIAVTAAGAALAGCGGSYASAGGSGSPTPTATQALTPTAADPSGEPMPKGNLPGWHQVFADNFDQTVPVGQFPGAVYQTWSRTYRDGLKDTSKLGTYEPTKVVSIGHGVMNIHVHTHDGVHMVAAVLPSIPGAQGTGGGLLYGRYSMRFRTTPSSGYKLAVLLWPDSEDWPTDGEIDFPELVHLNAPILAYMHHQGATTQGDQVAFISTASPQQWHTTTLTWLPTGATFQVDGQVIGTAYARIPNTPMHMIIQAETAIGGPVPTPTEAADIQIDWLTIYTPDCNRDMSVAPKKAACTPATLPALPT